MEEKEIIPEQESAKKISAFSKGVDKVRQIYVKSFSAYPVSLIIMLLLAVIGAVMYENDFSETVENNIIRIAMVLGIMAAPVLYCETFYPWKDKETALYKRLISLVSAVLMSGYFLYLSFLENEDYIFGINSESVWEISFRILACYVAAFIIFTIYRLYKNSALSFEDYCFKTFCQIVETTVVYGIFAIGFALLFLIIMLLLFDPGDFWIRMEILLLGGIYYPGLLLALAGSKKENGRFAEGVFKFVLTPLLIAAFVIVYLYIIKIIVTLTLPSNEVFGILTALFAFGLPIWTLTMSLKPHVMSRISSKLPLCFIPFIILQCICVFLRIKDYGFTFSRYMGITLIVFEIGYLCLYFIKNAKYVSFTLYYALILMFIVLLAPGINAFAAVTNSHKNILKDLPPKSEIMQMKAGHIAELAEAYRIILREGSIEGRLFLDKNVPKDTGEYLDRYYYDKDDNKGTTEVDYYVYLIEDFDEVDIRGYKTLDFVHADYHEPDISKVSLCYGYNLYRTEKEPLIEADLSKLLTDIADKKTAGEEPSISEPVETASGLLYLNRLDVDFTEDVDGNYKFDNLTIQGFLIQK